MLAVQGGDEEIVAVLVEGGANVNTQTEVGCRKKFIIAMCIVHVHVLYLHT